MNACKFECFGICVAVKNPGHRPYVLKGVYMFTCSPVGPSTPFGRLSFGALRLCPICLERSRALPSLKFKSWSMKTSGNGQLGN